MSRAPFIFGSFGEEKTFRDSKGQGYYPCSTAQKRIWVLDQIDPGNPALNISVRWRIEGKVSVEDLNLAFARIIDRHQTLRTSIAVRDGRPVQFVEPFLSFHIPEIDLGGLEAKDAHAEAERIAQLEARASFDLTVPPLIRATLLRLHGDVSIVLVTAHHMVCDDWSMQVLSREVREICAGIQRGVPPALSILPTSYGDYSISQEESASDRVRHIDEEFWATTLNALEHFEIRPDHARPPVQTSSGQIVSLQIDRELMDGLIDLSDQCQATMFMVTAAALFTLLHRYSGSSDISFASQVTGRDDLEVEGLVGVFINTIVLRGDLTGDPTFEELVARVQETVVENAKHLSTPFNRLIEILKPQRDLSRNALCSINLVFQKAGHCVHQYGNFELSEMPAISSGALYDLDFMMREGRDGWILSCEYNTDLFEADTTERLLKHFVNILGSAINNPVRSISTLSMLDDEEQHALMGDWNRTEAEYPRNLTCAQMFEVQAQRSPDAIAVVCGDQMMSYRELDMASNRLAHEMLSRGIGWPGRVGVCLERSLDLVVALLAVLKSGASYVPLDPDYPPARLALILQDAQPAALITKLAQRHCLVESNAEMILLDVEVAAIGCQIDESLGLNIDPEDVAYAIYTSGSTGRPKGVKVQHRALTNLLCSMQKRPGLADKDTLVSVTTISFDIAALELFLPLIVGAKLVIASQEECGNGHALLRLLRRHQATVMQATPVTWRILLSAGWHGEPRLKMLCGGEAMPRHLADQLLASGGELWNMYGPTETTIWSSCLRVEQGNGPVLIGPPIDNTQFYVLDRCQQIVPLGVPGELFIGGDGVTLGYLNLPDVTAERFVADIFRNSEDANLYRTGDLVRMRRNGEIEFLGRKDDQVKLRGFRIELGEIETVIREHQEIIDCVIVAEDNALGETLIQAYVVPQKWMPEKIEILVSSLRSGIRVALPVYMYPSAITVLEYLPRLPNGKIDRKSLPSPIVMPLDPAEVKAPTGDLERRLAQIWSDVLGAPQVEANSNFFEVGGHSLLAVRLQVRIEAEFGIKISLAMLFKHPTISDQEKLLQQGDQRAFDFRQVIKLQPNGSRPPLIAINNTGIYYSLSKHLGLDQPFISLQLFDPSLPKALLPGNLEDIAAGYAQLIRRVQRTGPYTLLGWCVAGTLAFEVARQLTASDQKVSQLILFDTWAPGHLERLPWIRSLLAAYSRRWKLIAIEWAKVRAGKQQLSEFVKNRVLVRKLMRQFFRKSLAGEDAQVFAGQRLDPEQYDQWLLQYLQDASDAYDPKPYSGSMMLFSSSREPRGRFLDTQMGWGDFVGGGVEVVVIDGDHFSIFQEPIVSQLAERIGVDMDASLAHAEI